MNVMLEAEVEKRILAGWRVHARGEDWAELHKGEKIAHGSNIFLTVITLGLWGIVYALMILFGGQKRVRVSVARRGKVRVRRI